MSECGEMIELRRESYLRTSWSVTKWDNISVLMPKTRFILHDHRLAKHSEARTAMANISSLWTDKSFRNGSRRFLPRHLSLGPGLWRGLKQAVTETISPCGLGWQGTGVGMSHSLACLMRWQKRLFLLFGLFGYVIQIQMEHPNSTDSSANLWLANERSGWKAS